jgi:uncharacterized membrane protein
MSFLWLDPLLGIVAGGALAWLGRRQQLLSRSGQVAIWGLILVAFVAQGWVWGVLVVLSILGAGLVTLFRRPYKAYLTGLYGPQAALNWLQVSARFGWPAVLALLSAAAEGSDYLVPFVGALATVSADIWATELGMLHRNSPFLITTRRAASHGTPGAISLLGITAGLGAAWLFGFLGLVLASLQVWQVEGGIQRDLLWLPLAALVGGMAGSFADSLLGGAAQAIYYCEVCKRYTDRPIHGCGRKAVQVRGWPWMTNEMVDLVSTFVGAAVTAGVFYLLAQSPWTW